MECTQLLTKLDWKKRRGLFVSSIYSNKTVVSPYVCATSVFAFYRPHENPGATFRHLSGAGQRQVAKATGIAKSRFFFFLTASILCLSRRRCTPWLKLSNTKGIEKYRGITKNAPYAWGNFRACAITRFQKPQQLSWAGRGRGWRARRSTRAQWARDRDPISAASAVDPLHVANCG